MKNFNSPSRGAGLSVVIFVSLLLAACDPSLGSRDSLPPEQAEQAPLGQAEDEEPEVDPDTGLPVFSDCAALQAESDWCLTFRGRSGSAHGSHSLNTVSS